MILVLFAVPEESRAFRRCVRARRVSGGDWEGDLAGERVRIGHTGVGPLAAKRGAALRLAALKPTAVVAAGFAGALAPTLAVGDLVLGTNFSDPELAAEITRFGGRIHPGEMLSVDAPAETPAAKAALAAGGALAVDMETAAIASVCHEAGLPFVALRAISDRAEESLPVPFEVWFDLEAQRPRVGALLAFLARHPRQIAAFARFVRGLRLASNRLSTGLFLWAHARTLARLRQCSMALPPPGAVTAG